MNGWHLDDLQVLAAAGLFRSSTRSEHGRVWHKAAFAATHPLGRDWSNNGHSWILARDGAIAEEGYARNFLLPRGKVAG